MFNRVNEPSDDVEHVLTRFRNPLTVLMLHVTDLFRQATSQPIAPGSSWSPPPPLGFAASGIFFAPRSWRGDLFGLNDVAVDVHGIPLLHPLHRSDSGLLESRQSWRQTSLLS